MASDIYGWRVLYSQLIQNTKAKIQKETVSHKSKGKEIGVNGAYLTCMRFHKKENLGTIKEVAYFPNAHAHFYVLYHNDQQLH